MDSVFAIVLVSWAVMTTTFLAFIVWVLSKMRGQRRE